MSHPGSEMHGVAGDRWPYPTTSVEREPVSGDCPACGASSLEGYPVLANGGLFLVVKCQACLYSVSRGLASLGYVHLPEEGIL